MPRNDTVRTPTPTKVNVGSGDFELMRRVFGNAMDVAGSTAVGLLHLVDCKIHATERTSLVFRLRCGIEVY